MSNPNFFTPSDKYYKYGDWGLTDSDKGTCYGNNCMKWSNGRVSVYGPGGFLRYSFDDKDGDFNPDVDEDGKYSYHFYNNDGDGVLDSSDIDDDNDGVPDYIEIQLGTDPKNPFHMPEKNQIGLLANREILLDVQNKAGHIITTYQKFIYDEEGNLKEIQIIEQDRYRDPETGNIKTKTKVRHRPPTGLGSGATEADVLAGLSNNPNYIRQPRENPLADKLKPYDTPQAEDIEAATTKELIDKFNSLTIRTEEANQIQQELYERITSGEYDIPNLEHMLGHGGNTETLINNILAQSGVEGYDVKDFDLAPPVPPPVLPDIGTGTGTEGTSGEGSSLKDKCWELCVAMGEDCEEMCGGISSTPTTPPSTPPSTPPPSTPTPPALPPTCGRYGMCGTWPSCEPCGTCTNPPCII